MQLSDNAHETRLKEVIEKYLRNNNYSLGGTDVFAAGELVDKLEVGGNKCYFSSNLQMNGKITNYLDFQILTNA